MPEAHAATQAINITNGSPSPNPANVTATDRVKWHNNDDVPHVVHLEGDEIFVDANSDSDAQGPLDPGTHNYTVQNDQLVVGSGQIIVAEPATTTTQQATTTTRPTTTTTGSTTTSTSSTTTTSSSTTTTTTPLSSFSGPVSVNSGGKSGGGSSALPLILGALVLVAALAGLAYWLWWRSAEPYDEEGPDWTQEPPPTVQGPRI